MDYIFEPTTKFTPIVNSPLRPLTDYARNAVVLGRDKAAHEKYQEHGTLSIGVICEHQPEEQMSLFGFKVLFDAEFPHIVFICGKRGSGKSYTLGVIAEELASSGTGIGTIIIDPVGTFWSMKIGNQNKGDIDILKKWGFEPTGFDNLEVLVPIGFYQDMVGIADGLFSIAIGDLTAEDWCLVFDIDRFKTQGLLIGEALEKVRNGYTAQVDDEEKKMPARGAKYRLGDVTQCIDLDIGINSRDEGYAATTRRSVVARFKAAGNWGLFSEDGTPLTQISVPNKVAVIDVSHSKLGDAKRALIVGILARKILGARMESSRLEEATALGIGAKQIETIPVTWLIIDEAHLLLPHVGKTAATESLVEYAKLGRKPGCGLVFATQRPAATNDEILSQVDTLIGHNLALEDDMAALRKRVPAMVPAEIRTSDFIRGIPVGVGIVADQKTQQRTMVVQIRPRLTHHAGKAALPKEIKDKGISEDEQEQEPVDEIKTVEIPENIRAALEKYRHLLEPSTSFEPPASPEPSEPVQEPVGEATTIKEGDVAAEGIPLQKVPSADVTDGEIKAELTRGVEVGWEVGNGYLLKCKSSDYAFKVINSLKTDTGRNILLISRVHPDKVKQTYGLYVNDIWWLSKSTEPISITPSNLGKISHLINEYVKSNENSVVFLEGLEYLISNNDFPKIMRLVEAIHETIVRNKSILILPVNPMVIDEKELQKLEHELDEVKDVKNLLEREDKIDRPDSVREAGLKELQDMCEALGLSIEGDIGQLKRRLLKHGEGKVKPKPKDQVVKPVKPEKAVKQPGSKPQPAPVQPPVPTPKPPTDDAVGSVLRELEKERKKLDQERLKVEKDKKRVDVYERKLKISEEKRKISAERKKAMLEKKRVTKERRELEKKQKELEKLIKQKEKMIVDEAKAQSQALEPTLDYIHDEFGTPPPALADSRGAGRRVLKKVTRAGKGLPTIFPKLSSDEIKLIVEDKHLDSTLLGRKKEQIEAITPIFLPLLKIYLKTTSSSKLFGKERSSELIWDLVTGEIVIDHKRTLRRTAELSKLFDLPPSQVKVLIAMHSRAARDVQTLAEDANMSLTETKRTITSLKKNSLVSLENNCQPKTKGGETYTRTIELKNVPDRLEKVKLELPRIRNYEVTEEILAPQFKLKDIEKMAKALSPRSTVLGTETIYYPYFKILIRGQAPGKGGIRFLVLDATSGKEDKKLTEIVRFLQ